MTATGGHDSSWDSRRDLPQGALAALERDVGDLVAIVATVDEDGAPRTAAFGAMRALSPRRLRFPCRRSHATYANLVRDGRVMVALYAAPDVAVGVRGRAHVVREQLRSWPDNALIQVEVDEVKHDWVARLTITSGISYAVPEELVAHLDVVNAELLEP
jgi:hypothetical protein